MIRSKTTLSSSMLATCAFRFLSFCNIQGTSINQIKSNITAVTITANRAISLKIIIFQGRKYLLVII